MFEVFEFDMDGWGRVYASEERDEAFDWVRERMEERDLYHPDGGADLRVFRDKELIWQG